MAPTKEAAPRTIGEAIRKARVERGLSQNALARELLSDPKTVSGWENGHHDPEMEAFLKLSRIFGWPLPFDPAQDDDGEVVPLRRDATFPLEHEQAA